jgi:citrate lyase beta subunit
MPLLSTSKTRCRLPKSAQREALAAWISPDRPVLLRINDADSEWFRDDLDLCGLPGVAGVVLPKAEQEHHLAIVAAAGATAILPLIESAQGLWNAIGLARAPGVRRLVFGAIDFTLISASRRATRNCWRFARNWYWCRAWPASRPRWMV